MSQIDELQLSDGRVELLDLPGDAAAPAIILLHEGLGSVGRWREFPRRLQAATGARVIAFSRYGHGGSDPPPRPRTPAFMHEEALATLPELTERLGIVQPVLVGHSDGASIALLHATRHDVTAVVAMAPHVFVEQVAIVEIANAKASYESGDLKPRMARHHRDPDAAFYGWNDVWLDPEFGRSWDIRPELARITAPVLLIQGTRDEYGTLKQLDEIEKATRTRTERRQLDCGHQPHLERPEETLSAIAEFVRTSELRAGARTRARPTAPR
jgi:pimeloyl-ACP methyl ester carboxylesterase